MSIVRMTRKSLRKLIREAIILEVEEVTAEETEEIDLSEDPEYKKYAEAAKKYHDELSSNLKSAGANLPGQRLILKILKQIHTHLGNREPLSVNRDFVHDQWEKLSELLKVDKTGKMAVSFPIDSGKLSAAKSALQTAAGRTTIKDNRNAVTAIRGALAHIAARSTDSSQSVLKGLLDKIEAESGNFNPGTKKYLQPAIDALKAIALPVTIKSLGLKPASDSWRNLSRAIAEAEERKRMAKQLKGEADEESKKLPADWQSYVDKTSDKKNAKLIWDYWSEIAGDEKFGGGPGMPGNYTTKWKSWVKWYNDVRKAEDVMKLIGKKAGDHLSPSDVVDLLKQIGEGVAVAGALEETRKRRTRRRNRR